MSLLRDHDDKLRQIHTSMRIGVIGSGPVGLYAAFSLVSVGHEVAVLERSPAVAANVQEWGFVKLFSALSLNVPADLRAALEAAPGTSLPLPADDAYITGAEARAASNPKTCNPSRARACRIALSVAEETEDVFSNTRGPHTPETRRG